MHNGQLFFPTPRDALLELVEPDLRKYLSVRPTPISYGEGTDLPNNLQPCLPPAQLHKESKPPPTPQWWPAKRFFAWLADHEEIPHERDASESGFPFTTPRDTRTHVKIKSQTGTSSDGDLFTTTALDLNVPPAICRSAPAFSIAFAGNRFVRQPPLQSPQCNGCPASARRRAPACSLAPRHGCGGRVELSCWNH